MRTLESYRGTGRTTRQIEALPLNSFFFVHTQAMKGYVRRLCEKLGRTDIRIATLVALRDQNWQGCEIPGADIDHAAREHMGAEHEIAWANCQAYLGRQRENTVQFPA